MRFVPRKILSITTVVAALSFSTIAFVQPAVAEPLTFVVNVTTDASDVDPGNGVCETEVEGECSLRAALEEANLNPGADTVNFNIPGGGVQRIVLESDLPWMTDEIHIDGSSQPGYAANTSVFPEPLNGLIAIEIDASNLWENLNTPTIAIAAPNSSVNAISMTSCQGACIGTNGNNFSLTGSYLGVTASGLEPALPAGSAFSYSDGSNLQVGGSNPEDRNIMASSSAVGSFAVNINSGDSANIYGNYVGLAADGETPLGSAMGLLLAQSTNSVVGGPGAGQGNLIAGHSMVQAVSVFSDGATFQGNLIGTTYEGSVTQELKETNGTGLFLEYGTQNTLVGGTEPGQGNIVGGVAGTGISVFGINTAAMGELMDLIPYNITILGNKIFDIGIFNLDEALGINPETVESFGDSNQAIDILFSKDNNSDMSPDEFTMQGVNENDEGDVDDGPNNKINFPELLGAVQSDSGVLTVDFNLDVVGSPGDEYRVEFFANDVSTIFGTGPAQQYLGGVTSSSGDGRTAVIDLEDLDIRGKSLSATVTVIDDSRTHGYGETSELSKNISVGTDEDVDSDGISNAMEQGAPNDGDGNNDSIPDYLQSTITSYVISGTSTYATFVTEGCSENGSVSSLAGTNLLDVDSVTDEQYEYPFGLTDFRLNCSRGDSVNVTKYIFIDADVTGMTVRKYRPGFEVEFVNVPDSTIENVVVGGINAIRLEYSLEDGGELDDDGVANGVIVDPVGIAKVKTSSQSLDNSSGSANSNGGSNNKTTAKGSLATTGAQYLLSQLRLSIILLATGVVLILGHEVLTRRKRGTIQ